MLTQLLPFPNISPEIFSVDVFGLHFALRWYALAYIAGVLLAWYMLKTLIANSAIWPNDTSPMTSEQLERLITWSIIGIILGGRIGYMLFYDFQGLLENPAKIIRVWDGGMSFHGGFAGVITAILLFTRLNLLTLSSIADGVAMVAGPGLFLGRVANFINGELWGRPTDVAWAVVFPSPGANTCMNVAEGCARHPSQLYEAGLEGLILGSALWFLGRYYGALKRPWLLTGIFVAGYGFARFIVEFFRQPDLQFVSAGNPLGWAVTFGNWGLTMGQLLTLPMIVIGLFVAIRAATKTQ